MNYIKPEEFVWPGIPGEPEDLIQKLFLEVEEQYAQQILDVFAGKNICWALSMLDRCKEAVLQNRILRSEPGNPVPPMELSARGDPPL